HRDGAVLADGAVLRRGGELLGVVLGDRRGDRQQRGGRLLRGQRRGRRRAGTRPGGARTRSRCARSRSGRRGGHRRLLRGGRGGRRRGRGGGLGRRGRLLLRGLLGGRLLRRGPLGGGLRRRGVGGGRGDGGLGLAHDRAPSKGSAAGRDTAAGIGGRAGGGGPVVGRTASGNSTATRVCARTCPVVGPRTAPSGIMGPAPSPGREGCAPHGEDRRPVRIPGVAPRGASRRTARDRRVPRGGRAAWLLGHRDARRRAA